MMQSLQVSVHKIFETLIKKKDFWNIVNQQVSFY